MKEKLVICSNGQSHKMIAQVIFIMNLDTRACTPNPPHTLFKGIKADMMMVILRKVLWLPFITSPLPSSHW